MSSTFAGMGRSRAVLSGTDVSLALVALVMVASAYFAQSSFLFAAVSAVLVVMSALRPAALVGAVPATIGFVNQPILFGRLEFSPLEFLIIAVLAGVGLRTALIVIRSPACAVTQFGQIVRYLGFKGFGPIAIGYLVLGALSLFTIADPSHLRESLREFRWVVAEPIAYFFLAKWFLRSEKNLWLSIIFFAFGAAVVAGSGFIEILSGAALSVEGVTRASGVYPHPNAFALYLERPLIFFALLAVVFRGRIRPAWFVVACLLAVALLLTFSRGALIASALVLVTMLALGQRRRLAFISGGIALLLVIPLGILAAERLTSLFDGGSGSLRLSIWSSSIQMIRDYPFFGVGLDQFLYQYNPRYVDPAAWPERFTSHPHNIILDLWLRLGIMSLMLAAAYAVIFLKRVRYAIVHRQAVALASVGAIGVGIIHGLVDNGYFLADLAVLFWFLTAVIDIETPPRDLEVAGITQE